MDLQNRQEYGITKETYIEAVIKGLETFQECQRTREPVLDVRLLLSIDRREDAEAAIETVCESVMFI
jgi:hypothetical protein